MLSREECLARFKEADDMARRATTPQARESFEVIAKQWLALAERASTRQEHP